MYIERRVRFLELEFIHSNYGAHMFDDTHSKNQPPQPEFDIEMLKNELPGWEEEWLRVLGYIYQPGGYLYTINGKPTDKYLLLCCVYKKWLSIHGYKSDYQMKKSSPNKNEDKEDDQKKSWHWAVEEDEEEKEEEEENLVEEYEIENDPYLDNLLGKMYLNLYEQGPRRALQSFDPASGNLISYLVIYRVRFLLRDTMRAKRARRETILDFQTLESPKDTMENAGSRVSEQTRNEILAKSRQINRKVTPTQEAILKTLLSKINERCLQADERTLRGRDMQQVALQLYPHYPDPPEAGQQKILEHLRNAVSNCHPNCSSDSYLREIHEYEWRRIETEKEAILKLRDTCRRGSRNSMEYDRKLSDLETESVFWPISKPQLMSLLNFSNSNADQCLSRYRKILKQFLSKYDELSPDYQEEQEEM